jgi:hypothetical protein
MSRTPKVFEANGDNPLHILTDYAWTKVLSRIVAPIALVASAFIFQQAMVDISEMVESIHSIDKRLTVMETRANVIDAYELRHRGKM